MKSTNERAKSQARLKAALKMLGRNKPASDAPRAFQLLIWELMITQTKVWEMDKKMHQVTRRMEAAEKDIKAGKKSAAVKVLKGAERKNEKLVSIDKNVRDPLIDKAKKVKKAFPKDWRRAK